MVLLATFKIGLIFVRQMKQGIVTLHFDCNYTKTNPVMNVSSKNVTN